MRYPGFNSGGGGGYDDGDETTDSDTGDVSDEFVDQDVETSAGNDDSAGQSDTVAPDPGMGGSGGDSTSDPFDPGSGSSNNDPAPEPDPPTDSGGQSDTVAPDPGTGGSDPDPEPAPEPDPTDGAGQSDTVAPDPGTGGSSPPPEPGPDGEPEPAPADDGEPASSGPGASGDIDFRFGDGDAPEFRTDTPGREAAQNLTGRGAALASTIGGGVSNAIGGDAADRAVLTSFASAGTTLPGSIGLIGADLADAGRFVTAPARDAVEPGASLDFQDLGEIGVETSQRTAGLSAAAGDAVIEGTDTIFDIDFERRADGEGAAISFTDDPEIRQQLAGELAFGAASVGVGGPASSGARAAVGVTSRGVRRVGSAGSDVTRRVADDLDVREFVDDTRAQRQRGGQRSPDRSGSGDGLNVDMDELDDLLGDFERAERSRRVQERVDQRILERNRERADRQDPRRDEGLDPENRGDPSSSPDRERFDPDRSAVSERGDFDTTRSGPRSTQQQQMDSLVRSQFNIDAGRSRSTSSGLDTDGVDLSAADDVPGTDLRDVTPAPSTTTGSGATGTGAGAGAAGAAANAELGELDSASDPSGIAPTRNTSPTATQDVAPINDQTGIDTGADALDLDPGRLGGGTLPGDATGSGSDTGTLDETNDPTQVAPPESRPGSQGDSDTEPGTDIGTEPAGDTGVDTPTDVGIGPGGDTVTDTETDTGLDTPPAVGTDTPPVTTDPPTTTPPATTPGQTGVPGRPTTQPPRGGAPPTTTPPRRTPRPRIPDDDEEEDREDDFLRGRFGTDEFTNPTQSLGQVDDALTEGLDGP